MLAINLLTTTYSAMTPGRHPDARDTIITDQYIPAHWLGADSAMHAVADLGIHAHLSCCDD